MKKYRTLSDMPIELLREAARTWRQEDIQPSWTGWRVIERNKSLHDCIDELIDEVERLRKNLHCRGSGSSEGL